MRKERRRKKRLSPVVWRSLFLFMSLSIVGVFVLFQWMLPDTVRVLQGEESRWYAGRLIQITPEDPEELKAAELSLRPDAAEDQTIEIQRETPDYISVNATLSFCGIPIKSVNLQVWEQRQVRVSGRTVGLDIYTDGVLVLGTGKLKTAQGETEAPAKGLIFTGDRIDAINGQAVSSAQEIMEAIRGSGDPVTVTLRRGDRTLQIPVTPVATEDGAYKIGIWIRDRAQGIGTLTYYDEKSGAYGAVGHAITDVDTGEILPAGKGWLMGARVRGLSKGQKGSPGEVEASLTSKIYGDIQANTERGVFGKADQNTLEGQTYPVAFRSQIREGRAEVITDLVSGTPQAYEVRIEKIAAGISGRAGLVVEITDERLLNVTGGIIQGM